MKRNRFFTIISLLLLLFFTTHSEPNIAQTAQHKQIWAKSFLGQKAPALEVEGWINEPSNTKGKYIMVDIWSTGCRACRKLIPELNYWQKEFKNQLVIIGVSTESKEKVEPFAEKNIHFACGYDTQSRLKNALKVTGIPHVIIINPKGIVVWEGFPNLPGYQLSSEVIKKLLQ